MAKKKNSQTSLIINIIVIAFAVLTICTLFMPVIFQRALATDSSVFTAKGADVLSAMFASEVSKDMSAGAVNLYLLRTSEEAAFVTTLFSWLYLITLCVSIASLVFAILNMIGLQFKMVNKVLGIALVALALLTFLFAILTSGKLTAVDDVLGKEVGFKGFISVGIYFLIGTLIGGGAQYWGSRK